MVLVMEFLRLDGREFCEKNQEIQYQQRKHFPPQQQKEKEPKQEFEEAH